MMKMDWFLLENLNDLFGFNIVFTLLWFPLDCPIISHRTILGHVGPRIALW